MIIRYFSSAALGLCVAAGLLWLMHLLIDIGPETFVEAPRATHLVWLAAPPVVIADDEPEPPERPPPPAEPPRTRPPGNGDGVPGIDPPTVGVPDDPEAAWELPDLTPGDGPLVAVMTVRPVYPARATSSGLEGYVVVQFDVDELGSVVNVAIVESSHTIFERAAVDAAKRSKFRARVVDGVAVATTGVRKAYRFELEK